MEHHGTSRASGGTRRDNVMTGSQLVPKQPLGQGLP